jgi:hypothetical protein
MSSPSSKLATVASLCLFSLSLQACHCGEESGTPSSATESAAGPSEGAANPSEAPAPERANGPLGRVVIAFDDEVVTTRTLLLHRIGGATEEASAEPFGTAFIGGTERTLELVSEEAVTGRNATLFGPAGTCDAPIVRTLTLQSRDEAAARDRYEALEVTGCPGAETTYPFGLEGSVQVEEFSTQTMQAPSAEVSAAVAEVEREGGGGEEMELLARALPSLGITVVQGWGYHVVRGSVLVESFEGGIPASVTVGERTLLMVRDSNGLRLVTANDSTLERLAIEAAE